MILFDLDGTLLPMDQDIFVKTYFGMLAKKLAPYGYEADALIPAIWKGTSAMVKNNGEQYNEEVFWSTFCEIFGEKARKDIGVFEEFYQNEFNAAKSVCQCNELAAEVVCELKEKGFRIALATNPLFPAIATVNRIGWAGLTPDSFEYISTYENSKYTKPNPNYYLEIIEKLGVQAEDCLMVGNSVSEDMVAKELGMKVFLLTDCLINEDNIDISQYPNGNFTDLRKYIEENMIPDTK